MVSACERVLDTPELLETILLQLQPLNHLLSAQLVSSDFHKTITRSPRLQQALFLRAKPNDAIKDPKGWRINPLLRLHFLPWFVGGDDPSVCINYANIRMLDWTSTKKDAFLRAEASWRKMLLLQPPPKQLEVHEHSSAMLGITTRETTVSFDDPVPGGVTMGFVYDITESFMRKESGAEFSISIEDSAAGPQMTLDLQHAYGCLKGTRDPEEEHFIFKNTEERSKIEILQWNIVDPMIEAWKIYWGRNVPPENGGATSSEWEEWEATRKSRTRVR